MQKIEKGRYGMLNFFGYEMMKAVLWRHLVSERRDLQHSRREVDLGIPSLGSRDSLGDYVDVMLDRSCRFGVSRGSFDGCDRKRIIGCATAKS